MILSVGEILIDMIGHETKDGIDFESHPGGAPLNVAAQIAKLSGSAYFVGAIGNDIPGQYLNRYIKTLPLKGSRLEMVPDRNTTLAFVTLSKEGERDFCFYRENTADYVLPELEDDFLKKMNIVHIGSLMLSKDDGLDYALCLAEKAKNNGCLISFDVNFRNDIYPSVDEAIRRSKILMEKADFIKMSDDEIQIFGDEYFASLVKSHHVFLSKGKNGSSYYYKDTVISKKTHCVKPVDTTGAGDAFYGAILSQLDENLNYTDSDMENMLALANACGALATLGKGAIAPLPDRKQAFDFIEKGEKA